MSRKRLSKKQLRQDRFVQQTFDWAHWAETHRSQVIGGVIVLAVAVAGFFVYRSMSRGAEARAATEYLSARQSFFAGNYPLGVSDLQGFLARHGGSSYADDARFFLALAQYRGGQYEEAASSLRDFLDRHGDSPFADNARWLLAASYQEAGQLDQAVQIYADAIDKAEYDERKVRLHRALAAVYEAQRQDELAAEQYRAIVALDPDGIPAEEARRALAELTIEPLGVGGDAGGATEDASDAVEDAESGAGPADGASAAGAGETPGP